LIGCNRGVLFSQLSRGTIPLPWFKFLTDMLVISTELLTTYMLPGLHSVLKDMETLEKDQVPAVQQLIRNCQSKVEEYQKQATGSSETAVTGDSKTSTFISKLIPPFDRDISISPSKLFKKKS